MRCSNDNFDGALATDGFSQNRGKVELLMHLVEEGSFTDRRLVRDGKDSLPGKVVTVARHVGSHLGEEKASFAHELAPKAEASHDDGFLLCWSVVVREQGVVEAQEVLLHWSCGQHSSIWNRGFLSLESTVPIAYVAGDLSGQEGDGRSSGEKGRSWACPHTVPQGGTAFLEIGAL